MNADSAGLLAFSVLYLKQRGVPAGKAAAAGAVAALSGGSTGLLVPIVVGARQSGDTSLLAAGSGSTVVEVPDVTGHDAKEAAELIKKASLTPVFSKTYTETEKEGTVVFQKPEDGEYAEVGSRVMLVVAQLRVHDDVSSGEDGKVDKILKEMQDVVATTHATLAKVSEYSPAGAGGAKPAPARSL